MPLPVPPPRLPGRPGASVPRPLGPRPHCAPRGCAAVAAVLVALAAWAGGAVPAGPLRPPAAAPLPGPGVRAGGPGPAAGSPPAVGGVTPPAGAPRQPPAAPDPHVAAARAAHRAALPRVPEVRGVYVPPGILASPARLQALVDLVGRTELDALVLDVKADDGTLTHPSELAPAAELGAIRPRVSDMRRLVAELRRRGIYAIARVVAFKDPVAAARRPAWAVQDAAGRPWRDRKGLSWLNPYHPDARAYVLAVAREAALLGFHEVQFDYVRFPSDGPVYAAVYPGRDRDGRPPARVIGDFLREADALLAPYGVRVSADVFGQVPSVDGDMGIGQLWEEVAVGIDAVSPMIYPSHYGPGVYGLPDPDRAPYATVRAALRDALRRVPPGAGAVVRPWLQDFSLRARYGPDEVRAQIRAVYDAGLSQWLLWNPGGRYTEEALAPAR